MNCDEIRDQMMTAAIEGSTASVAVEEHVRACTACAENFASMQKTMALLDHWQVPEPSPYFDTRLRARLREAKLQPQGWFAWIRKPALAFASALLIAAGVMMFQGGSSPKPGISVPDEAMVVKPGTPVGDLEILEDNHDLYANFDMLDDLGPQQQGQGDRQ